MNNKIIEKIPTWAMCYLVNGDASGLTDEEFLLTSLSQDRDIGLKTGAPAIARTAPGGAEYSYYRVMLCIMWQIM